MNKLHTDMSKEDMRKALELGEKERFEREELTRLAEKFGFKIMTREAYDMLQGFMDDVRRLNEENKALWIVFKECPGCVNLVPGTMYGCPKQKELVKLEIAEAFCGAREVR